MLGNQTVLGDKQRLATVHLIVPHHNIALDLHSFSNHEELGNKRWDGPLRVDAVGELLVERKCKARDVKAKEGCLYCMDRALASPGNKKYIFVEKKEQEAATCTEEKQAPVELERRRKMDIYQTRMMTTDIACLKKWLGRSERLDKHSFAYSTSPGEVHKSRANLPNRDCRDGGSKDRIEWKMYI